jgi:hypothetical protein
VEVEDLLPRITPVVDPDGVTTFRDTGLLGYGARHLEEALDHAVGKVPDLLQVGDVLPGDDEEMDGGLAIYVSEGQHIVLVVDHLGVYFPSRYFTEYAVSLAHSTFSSSI